MNPDLKQFLERCKAAQFRNREELLRGLESGAIRLSFRSDTPYPAQHFLRIYERRAEHLNKVQTKESERLRKDVLEFVQNLTDLPTEQVILWGFEKQRNGFAVFETPDTGKILGCVKWLDKPFVSEAELKTARNQDH